MHPSHSGIYQKQYTQITLCPPSLNLTRYTQQMRFQPALNKTFSPSCHQTPAGNQSTPNHENKMRRLFFFNKRFTISNIEKQIIIATSGVTIPDCWTYTLAYLPLHHCDKVSANTLKHYIYKIQFL